MIVKTNEAPDLARRFLFGVPLGCRQGITLTALIALIEHRTVRSMICRDHEPSLG
jgi:hypothetical protein